MAYTLLIQGLVQIIIAIVLFITISRRGKNRLIKTLAWLFISVGIFNLGPFLPSIISAVPPLAAFAAYSSMLCHTSIFFGLSGYCGAQIGILKGRHAARISYVITLSIATFLVFVHILGFSTSRIGPFSVEDIKLFAEQTMFFFFMAAIIFVAAIFLSMYKHFKQYKAIARYTSITGMGLVLMIVALLIRKVLDTIAPNIYVDAISLLSLTFVIIGVFMQMSLSASPGVVYDSRTKKPIPLAIVRLIKTSENKLVESRVTEKSGRYGIVAEAGKYKLDVVADGYKFPSTQQGGYAGEQIEFKIPTLLGLEIPMDPIA